MKKNFFKKKLASGLALALVIASLAPAGISASAATATKIVKQGGATAPNVLYVGDKGTDYSLSNVYKTNTYSWKISNSKIATINAKTGVVTAKTPGTVTIRVTARNAKTNKWLKDFTKKVYIKQRVESVDISSEDFSLAIDEVKDLNAVKNPKTSTDVLVYASSDEKIATVDAKTGVVKAVAPGEATITVYAKGLSSSPITSKYNRTDSVKVTVLDGIVSAKQTESSKLELTFATEVASGDIATADISIVNTRTNVVYAVKTVTADGTKTVKVETFAAMVDGDVYKVTYDEKTVDFTATNNEVASLSISPVAIPYETETEIKVSTLDANKVVLNTYTYGSVSDTKLEFNIATLTGYTSAGKLYLPAIGNTAKATATYHTYEYDANGKEIGAIPVEVTITAVDKTAIGVTGYNYTVASSKPNWDTFTQNTRIAVGDSSKFWLNVNKTNDAVAVNGDYTFESSNPNILFAVTDNNLTGELSATLTPVAVGSAYVLVKDINGKVVWSLPVNVVASRDAASLILDKTAVTVSNSSDVSIGTGDEKEIEVTLVDQYGDDLAKSTVAGTVPELRSSQTSGQPTVSPVDADGIITVNGQGATAGTYQYSITIGKFTRTFNVVVVAPNMSLASNYQVVISDTGVDTKITSTSATEKDIVIKIAEVKGNVLVGYVNFAGTRVVDDTEATDPIVIRNGSTVVTGSAIQTTASGSSLIFKAYETVGGVVSKADTGSYSVVIKYTVGTLTYNLSTGFSITDTQPVVVAKKVVDKVAAGVTPETAIATAYDFSYNGADITVNASDITAADVTTTSTGIFVKTAYVNVPVGGSHVVPVKVTFNSSILFQ